MLLVPTASQLQPGPALPPQASVWKSRQPRFVANEIQPGGHDAYWHMSWLLDLKYSSLEIITMRKCPLVRRHECLQVVTIVLLCPNKLSRASWPVQLAHQNVIQNKNVYTVVACVYCAICIILTCAVTCLIYKCWRSGSLDLQLDLGRPSRAKPSKASSVESPMKCSKTCG
jgi:hypothetical protein